MQNEFYIGTDLKFKFEIKANGFDMATDDFSVVLRHGRETINVPQENIVNDGEGNYYLLINTSMLKSGSLEMIVTAEVPDEDFPSGIRHEIAKVRLCSIKSV